ncbi:MAG: ABC transporter ATP-binding protein, partial [Sulfurovaceae bacterium]
QKQRVALCRAMMNSPKLLLMDEPLSALDPSMRARLQDEILLLHKEFGTTTIMVSHEPSEIYKLASRVIVLENGKLLKEGTPKDVLLKRSGSQKFSFEGEIIDMIQADIISVAIISIGQQLVEVVLSAHEKEKFKIGDRVNVSTKAFGVNIAKGGGR